jgi:Uma2 family endonuclease
MKRHRTGAVYSSETAFRIARQPDRTLSRRGIRPFRARHRDRWIFEGPPDAAFEVTSPGDTYSEIGEKTLDWLRAGVKVVVIVDPRTKTARVHRAEGAISVKDITEIDDVIPGWQQSLAELFD